MGAFLILFLAVGIPTGIYFFKEYSYKRKIRVRVDEFEKEYPFKDFAKLDVNELIKRLNILRPDYDSRFHELQHRNNEYKLILNCHYKETFEDHCCVEYVKRFNKFIKL